MKIHHQGWNEAVGVFSRDVTLDENKSDYKIVLSGGRVFHQCSPFHTLPPTQEMEPKFGAYFRCNNTTEFFTPTELVSLVLNGYAMIPDLRIGDH